jgi:hypothetical protein
MLRTPEPGSRSRGCGNSSTTVPSALTSETRGHGNDRGVITSIHATPSSPPCTITAATDRGRRGCRPGLLSYRRRQEEGDG